MPPKLVAAAPGYTRLKLEEPYRPTAPFLVKSFLRHAERVKYVPKLGDGDLLRSAGELSFELEKQPVLRSNNLHQLYSVRHSALPESKQGKRDWNGHRRNYRVAVPVQHPASKVDRAEAKETVPPERCVMLRVALYHGTKKAREFEVHQHQTLYELRRVLTCPTAAEIAYQRAELARRGGEELLEHFPAPSDGAAFCIEDAWFVSGGDDPSESVRSYVNAEGGQHWGEPRRMDETTIGDLTLRLGQQYLYVHHGDCEHSIVFTRCYLLNELDTLHRPPRSWGGYPRLVFERFVPTPYCTTCEREPAVWEVVGDKLADRSPCRLCEVCHYQFHYDKDGHLIKANGDYFIYPILKEVGTLSFIPPVAIRPLPAYCLGRLTICL